MQIHQQTEHNFMNFLMKIYSFDGYELDLSLKDWLVMQLTELMSSTLWVTKLAGQKQLEQEQLETTAGHLHLMDISV